MKTIRIYECYGIMDDEGNCPKDLTFELINEENGYPIKKLYFKDWLKTRSEKIQGRVPESAQIQQWLYWIASECFWPSVAKEIVEYALKYYDDYTEYY